MPLPYAEVIGDPIAHSKSPLIHGFWLQKLGIEAEYRKTHVRPEELSAFLAERRRDPDWRGCNVTVPHKEAVIAHLDRLDPLAERVGAVNTVVPEENEVIGYNSDVAGVLEPIYSVADNASRVGARTTIVQVIGAGGAARAVGAAFAGGEISFFNRTRERAAALADEFSGAGVDFCSGTLDQIAASRLRPKPEESQWLSAILINASTLGMAGQPTLPLDLRQYPDDTIVFDMVYAPLETPLLAQARALGMRTIDGLQMLVAQAAAAFALFFGQPAPREHDAELRALLTA